MTKIQNVDDTAIRVDGWMTSTEPRPIDEIRETISSVVEKAGQEHKYALDLVTMLQAKARLANDTGKRLSFAEFADEVGINLEQLRASE